MINQNNDFPMGIWIPEARVPSYEASGYRVSDPQPKLAESQQLYRRGTVHMTKVKP